MRRTLILLSFAIILLVAVANVYRDPRVQDLFRSVPRTPGAGSAQKQASRPAPHASHAKPTRAESLPAAPTVPNRHVQPQELEVESARDDRVPNETVSRVLLQVLAAKGLARGVALEVSDESIKVFGEVDSEDKRETILTLIEKGRGSRRLDAAGLTVQR
jgi:hypothetical protein